MNLLFDPLFRTPLLVGLVAAALLPLLGCYLRLRDEWLAALGLAHVAAACHLLGLSLHLPVLLSGIGGAVLAVSLKQALKREGNGGYALMMLGGWAALYLIAANTALGEAISHALSDGQLYFANREQLLAAAKAAFTETGADAPLEEIARRAGVGIGTLYRHFRTRDALVTAVYRREVEQLTCAADSLLASRRPGEALEAWLHLLVDFMATKRVAAPVLRTASGEAAELYASSGAAITASMTKLAQAAAEAGDIRPDIGTEDLYRMVMGISHGHDRPGWEPSARRLIGVVMAGLKPPRP